MWYLEGNWISNQTLESERFEYLMASLDATQVFNDLTKGVALLLREGEIPNETRAIGISLNNGKLFVRRIT